MRRVAAEWRQGVLPDLAGSNALAFEWSLRVDADHCVERQKCIVWLRRRQDQRVLDINGLLARLVRLNCPQGLLAMLAAARTRILAAGLGVSQSGEGQGIIYVHSLSDAGMDLYRAYTWDRNTAGPEIWQSTHYSNCFLPQTPSGLKPQTLVHVQLRELFYELSQTDRVRQISSFWLRRKNESVDQICLTFSWLPGLADYLDLLMPYCTARYQKTLRDHAHYHFRHIAFSGAAHAPAITIYFCGEVEADTRFSFRKLQTAANRTAAQDNEVLHEEILSKTSMPRPQASSVDLNAFYSPPCLDKWQQVLGGEMHYHHGEFAAEETPDPDDDAPFVRAVEEIAGHIDKGSSVYDLGCGWGGIARYLAVEKQCDVLGITISESQYRYCNARGCRTRWGDMELTLPPGVFDVALLVESLEHVHDKLNLLRNLRPFCDKLVIRMNCQDHHESQDAFAGSMQMVSSIQLRTIVERADWRIVHWQDIRPRTLKSALVWQRRLEDIEPGQDFHLETLRAFCERINPVLHDWGTRNPLIEVVAQ